MEYLEQTLKIKVRYCDWDKAGKLPYMITDRFNFQLAWLNDYEVLFVFAKDEPDQLAVLKKQMKQIRRIADLPIVLVLEKIDARRRKQLIDAGIAFVVPKQQIYLPFLGIVLQDRYTKEYTADERLMPSSELLLLYYINNRCMPLYMNEATKALGFSSMTISRAIRQLEATHLIRTYKDGVNKVITSELKGKMLFDTARTKLSSPVRKTVYIDLKDKSNWWSIARLAGYSALSEYSLLSPTQVECFAVSKMPLCANGASKILLDSDKQLRLEIWNYDPLVLSNNKIVGLLPLVLSLQDDTDARVQQALDEALEQYWEKYNG